jgi:putative SOS response-associated peptidase YedK
VTELRSSVLRSAWPVTLTPELAREWLDPATPNEHAEQMVLLQGEPTEAFEWFRVDRAIGNVRNQGAALITPTSPLES